MSTVVSADHEYAIDPHTGSIMEKHSVHGARE